MVNKRYAYHGWTITYPEDMCLFTGEKGLLVTSMYQRAVLGQIRYCPDSENLHIYLSSWEVGFIVNHRELSLFFTDYRWFL